MFDTHCHLNFKAFEGKAKDIIEAAKSAGVNYFVIPGTDEETSKAAVEIAGNFAGVYAAVGIHPHHIFDIYKESNSSGHPKSLKMDIFAQLLLQSKKIVAVGEVGLDRHYYKQTKYKEYEIDEKFMDLQKEFLKAQIKLALEHDKSLILHNREAKKDLLEVLNEVWNDKLKGRTVFHCCEPDVDLLNFAREHKIYIGVDGDVTYNEKKQEFVKKIPLELLVLETDSPYLLPEPLRKKNFLRLRQGFGGLSNEPKNLPVIAEFIAKLTNTSINQLIAITTVNAKKLFNLD